MLLKFSYSNKVETGLPTQHAQENNISSVDEHQLYAEIKDPDEALGVSSTPTENVRAALNPTHIIHDYENTKIHETTLCVAYGVVLEAK